MSLCVQIVDSVLQTVSGDTCDYVLLAQDELTQLVNSQTDWASYLDFDFEIFNELFVGSLTTFIIGHGLGRVLKIFGKV